MPGKGQGGLEGRGEDAGADESSKGTGVRREDAAVEKKGELCARVVLCCVYVGV